MSDTHTILIVDDTPENLAVLGGVFQPDYRVKVASSGARALQVAGIDPTPDLILLDVMMPGMDGFAVLEHLRDDPTTRDIPVIFVTGRDTQEDEERGFMLGAVDYIKTHQAAHRASPGARPPRAQTGARPPQGP